MQKINTIVIYYLIQQGHIQFIMLEKISILNE